MENESRNEPGNQVESLTPHQFFKYWREYNAGACALLATLNGLTVAGFISAAQDLAHGEIGHGITKAALTVLLPFSDSIVTGMVMLENAQFARSNPSDEN